MRQIDSKMFQVILCTPPCSTFSRVRCANKRGPPPVRDANHPAGYPWLKDSRAHEAWLGTMLVEFSIKVFQTASQVSEQSPDHPIFLLWEHPEDLGMCVREEDDMHIQPASVWQLDAVRDLVNHGRPPIFTVVFTQCCHGAPYRKPTRFLTNLPDLRSWGPADWPLLDDDGFYLGPLQHACTCQIAGRLSRSSQDSGFRTSATAAYPCNMDTAIALAIQNALKSATCPSVGSSTCLQADARSGIPVDTSVGSPCRAHGARTCIEEVATSVASAQVGGGVKQSWGHGPQIMAWYIGSSRPIHDGGGLLSPGRWPIGRRDYSLSDRGEGLRDVVHEQFKYWCEAVRESGKDVMKDKFWPAAAGLIRESPFSEHIESARFAVDEFLHQEGLEPGRRPEDLESEIAFRRIAAAAEVLGDVDFQYLREVAEVGVPIGVGVELPRVPDVFEPKVKWNLSEAEGEFVDTKADNYSSAVESMAKVREQVEEDVRKGFIKRMSRSSSTRADWPWRRLVLFRRP